MLDAGKDEGENSLGEEIERSMVSSLLDKIDISDLIFVRSSANNSAILLGSILIKMNTSNPKIREF
jgi:hypothetical protein